MSIVILDRSAFASGDVMYAQKAHWAMILAIAAAAPAVAGAASDKSQAVTDAENDYKRTELAIYDALSTDPSPRIAILAGQIYIPRDDATPTALRPKREQVIARAVENAPDDAFVQWMAASQGNFFSSACGPTTRPEAEVANLIRLEPDNAAAWQFAVALARAKGDEAGVDTALSHMAASAHADDHTVETIGAWTTAAQVHSEIVDNVRGYWFGDETEPTPQQKPLIEALSRVMFDSQPAKATLEAVCKPDAKSDRMWQRLGWCADAGKLFAEKGASLALRKQGLDLLAAADVHDDDVAKAQRQYDWLEEHDANPTRGRHVSNDSPANVAADWQGAATEIAAIEQRLKRLGQPSTPPPEWTKAASSDDKDDSAAARAAEQAYSAYMKALIEDMRTSAAPEQRAFALLNGPRFLSSDKAVGSTADDSELASLANAHPGNAKLQWMIATATVPDQVSLDTKASAIVRLQEIESDNAAAWALSLSAAQAGDTQTIDAALQHMAASKRYDAHMSYAGSIMLDAERARPMPDEAISSWTEKPGQPVTKDTAEKVAAMAVTAAMMVAPMHALQICKPSKPELTQTRRDACVAIGRLLVHRSTDILSVSFGNAILRKLDAQDAADMERFQQVRWWFEQTVGLDEMSTDIGDYLGNYFATGNEIEAHRLVAQRKGKLEPPADWSPQIR